VNAENLQIAEALPVGVGLGYVLAAPHLRRGVAVAFAVPGSYEGGGGQLRICPLFLHRVGRPLRLCVETKPMLSARHA
jgi:hypothetical protein